jgi:hypothetical protein
MIAELEKNPMRLPKPIRRQGESAHTDPEGTAAMPAIVKPSDRPPPPAPEQAPTSASPAPWAGSLPGYRPPAQRPPILLFAIGGALFASFIIVAALALLFVKRHRDSHDDVVTTQPTATTTHTIELPEPSASASSDVPVISVDSLPQAPNTKLHIGKLTVEAAPQACEVSVDGKSRGVTPLTSIDVSPGAHSLRCETSSGIAKTVSVSVVEGQTTHHHFSTSQ